MQILSEKTELIWVNKVHSFYQRPWKYTKTRKPFFIYLKPKLAGPFIYRKILGKDFLQPLKSSREWLLPEELRNVESRKGLIHHSILGFLQPAFLSLKECHKEMYEKWPGVLLKAKKLDVSGHYRIDQACSMTLLCGQELSGEDRLLSEVNRIQRQLKLIQTRANCMSMDVGVENIQKAILASEILHYSGHGQRLEGGTTIWNHQSQVHWQQQDWLALKRVPKVITTGACYGLDKKTLTTLFSKGLLAVIHNQNQNRANDVNLFFENFYFNFLVRKMKLLPAVFWSLQGMPVDAAERMSNGLNVEGRLDLSVS